MQNDKEILNRFLNSYHSTMDYLRMIATYPSEFTIFIAKYDNKENKDHTVLRISIIRNVIEDRDNSGHYLDIPTTLPNDLIIPAINGIRDDFRDNHEISYASISGDSKYQFLQNTHFKLSISIDNNEELEEAKKYNSEINCNPNRLDNNGLTKTRVNK